MSLERLEGLEQWLAPLFAAPDQSFEETFPIVDALLYYGHTTPLLPAMQDAWPAIRDSDKVFDFTIEEFATIAAEALTYEFLAAGPAAPGSLDDIATAMQAYVAPQRERLGLALAHAWGQVAREWHVQDFASAGSQALDPGFTFFMQDFTHTLHARHGFPYGKAGMASGELETFLAGQRQVPRGKRRRQASAPEGGAWLIPQADRLVHYLQAMLETIGSRPYRAAALWEAIPPYLAFLRQLRGLDTERLEAAIPGLRARQPSVLRSFDSCSHDPRLKKALAACWNKASD